MRLNKYIAESGYCSRRKADELIAQGRVTINKHVAILGTDVEDSDIVRVDGEKIKIDTDYEYYLLYKPKNVICTNYNVLINHFLKVLCTLYIVLFTLYI